MEFAPERSLNPEDKSGGGVFAEALDLEFAARLLEVTNEQQLDELLDEVIRESGAAAGAALKPSDARSIVGALKDAIHRVLPLANMDAGAPVQSSVGARLGRSLASSAGQMLGLELEGLSPEDREFEAVRQFLRFAAETIKNAMRDSSGASAHERAHRAAKDAAEVYAPGLLPGGTHIPGNSGRWIACHDRIILYGV